MHETPLDPAEPPLPAPEAPLPPAAAMAPAAPPVVVAPADPPAVVAPADPSAMAAPACPLAPPRLGDTAFVPSPPVLPSLPTPPDPACGVLPSPEPPWPLSLIAPSLGWFALSEELEHDAATHEARAQTRVAAGIR